MTAQRIQGSGLGRWRDFVDVEDPNAPPWNPEYMYWVDSRYDGSNGPSDGSPGAPFTTIQEAIDLGWTEWASLAYENYATVIIAPGDYAEDALLLYPFVTLVGYDADSTRITSGSPIDIFSFGNYNLYNLRFETEWAVDMTSIPFFGFFTWFRAWDCRFDAEFQVQGRGANNHWYEFHGCYFQGNVDVQNCTWWMADSFSYASLMEVKAGTPLSYPFVGKDGNSYAMGFYQYDSFSTAEIVATQPAGTAGSWIELAGRLFNSCSADGGGTAITTVETTADGFPEDGLTLSNGAVQYPSGNALGLLYDPAAPGDWAAPAPETVGEAIDRLAAANPGA